MTDNEIGVFSKKAKDLESLIDYQLSKCKSKKLKKVTILNRGGVSEYSNHFRVHLVGGNNSVIGSWFYTLRYTKQIRKVIKLLKKKLGREIALDTFENDILDDVWYLNLIVYKKEGE